MRAKYSGFSVHNGLAHVLENCLFLWGSASPYRIKCVLNSIAFSSDILQTFAASDCTMHAMHPD